MLEAGLPDDTVLTPSVKDKLELRTVFLVSKQAGVWSMDDGEVGGSI